MKVLHRILAVCLLLGLGNACTDDFAELNTNPGLVNEPELSHLLTESLFQLGEYQYTEWFYDNYQYIWRYSEAVVSQGGNASDFNILGATGDRYGAFYSKVMQNLFEIRRRIDEMEEGPRARFEKLRALTYIPQVLQGLKVTDWYGSMPYTEALQGRRESGFTPAYDSQQQLFATWLQQLDDAIAVLVAERPEQQDLGSQDFIYQGDYAKWAKLANSLKLRIAVRLLNADPPQAQQIINEVVSSPAGIITEQEDQMVWAPATDYRGQAYDFAGEPSAAKNFVDFLRNNQDPRTRFFFEKNDFSPDGVDSLLALGVTLPKFVSLPVGEWDQYQGGPVSPDSVGIYDYFGVITDRNNSQYLQLSRVNRRFFDPRFENGTGYFVEVMFPAAEVNLYMAEFAEKGLVSQGTAQEWYNAGVALSLRSYDMMAEKAQIVYYDDLRLGEAETEALLARPDYALDGTNTLEKIYLQQYINFFRLPNEMGALTRRSGYPKVGSDLLPWEPVVSSGRVIPLPRRFAVSEPDIEVNLAHWRAAMEDQGFTVGANEGNVLNAERVWWDEADPNYGEGK